jgi:hypothetical protein
MQEETEEEVRRMEYVRIKKKRGKKEWSRSRRRKEAAEEERAEVKKRKGRTKGREGRGKKQEEVLSLLLLFEGAEKIKSGYDRRLYGGVQNVAYDVSVIHSDVMTLRKCVFVMSRCVIMMIKSSSSLTFPSSLAITRVAIR